MMDPQLSKLECLLAIDIYKYLWLVPLGFGLFDLRSSILVYKFFCGILSKKITHNHNYLTYAYHFSSKIY